MNRVGPGLAGEAGYVLGRTRKLESAFAVGTLVAGKRMRPRLRALADPVSRQLLKKPQWDVVPDTSDLGFEDGERAEAFEEESEEDAEPEEEETEDEAAAPVKKAVRTTGAARGAARSARARLPKGGGER